MAERHTYSLVIGFTPLAGTARVYHYRAAVEVEDTEEVDDYDCDAGVGKCDLVYLDSGTRYKVTVKACFRPQKVEELCSLPSGALFEWTMPEGIHLFIFVTSQIMYI